MGIVKLLDNQTINKIAAGEVVEKPASIVKELVENSIDAGSNEITVEIEGGGINLIRISDNGNGIYKDDLDLAFLRHATSKIESHNDLNSINTLGFRGEALASIASISKVEMISRTKEETTGYKIYLEGGRLIEKQEAGAPLGTTITVKSIFYNTPARLKFLKSESREGIYITDLMQNLAFSHPEISFKYKSKGKMVFATKGDGDLKSVILSIYGRETASNLIEVKYSADIISISGFIGNSSISKSSRNYQSIFINGRYVKNKTTLAAVEQAYKSMLTINKFPLYVLHIYTNPEFIDVNVHPSKLEIKFQDEQLIFKAIYHCIRESLISISPIMEANNKDGVKTYADNIHGENLIQQKIDIKDDISYKKPQIIDKNYNTIYDSFNNKAISNKTDRQFVINERADTGKTIKIDSALINKTPKFGPLAVVGQVHFTYIVAEGADEMYLIDQHAAHERVYYESYINEFKNSSLQSQNLIAPIVIELTFDKKQLVLENLDFLKRTGYEIDDFGGNSIALRCVPMIYGTPDRRELFLEIIENMDIKNKELVDIIDKVIYTMACKSAIKAGDKLNYTEMIELIEKLRYCDNPYTCPHGRPTIIKMSYTELEKKFKRIQ